MKCGICSEKAVYKRYCSKHFKDYFENKVKVTIKRFGLLKKKDNVAVAVSGGKDSMALLHVLHKLGYRITAVAVDEGIAGYRDKTLKTMTSYCKSEDIGYRIVSFKDNFGKTLDEIMDKEKIRPCSVCGVFRRYLLNLHTRKFDVIATGHNLDDEAQAILMNLVKSNMSLLFRLGPVSGYHNNESFTKRIKPFYLCPEKEVMIYSFLNKLNTEFSECPNVGLSFRLRIRDRLNEIELKMPGTKRNLVDWFLRIKEKLPGDLGSPDTCRICGEPSTKERCNACNYISELKLGGN